MEFKHNPIMLDKVINFLEIKKEGIYLDCTIGGAGHSSKILKQLDKKGLLVGLDKDSDALIASDNKLKKISNNYKLVKSDFKNVDRILNDLGITKIDGALLDLGVSSHQIDSPDRGFSYFSNVELDMRMDQEQKLTAQDILNNYSEKELIKILRDYGEEKFARSIAKNIVRYRNSEKIKTSEQLNNIIDSSIPRKVLYSKGHSSKKTFQALRIEVNKELSGLDSALRTIVRRLKNHGRIVVIAFHSLEDRIVKQTFNELQNDCICPKDFPICQCDEEQELKVITKRPLVASQEEKDVNTRSKSAKLRVAERVI